MSDTNLVLTPVVIEVLALPFSNFITQVIEVHEPIVSASQGPQGISAYTTMSNLNDISTLGLVDGSLLAYDSSTSTWRPFTLSKELLLSILNSV